MGIYAEEKHFILENETVRIVFSAENSMVKSVFDKSSQKEIIGEPTYLFSFVENDKRTQGVPTAVTLNENAFTIASAYGEITVEVITEREYFTFELTSSLPDSVYKLVMAHIKYAYDRKKNGVAAAGMAITYWANPCFYPDGKSKETKAEVVRYLKDKGAKYAFFAVPLQEHKALLKKITLTIDRNTGIRSEYGGAWGQECQLNHDNGMLLYYTDDEYLDKNISFLKELGADQIDICQGGPTAYYQGSFRYRYHKDAADFKTRFSDRLATYGMYPGLHTYAATVALDCAEILSKPEYQKQMTVKETLTLAADIDENTMLIPIREDWKAVSCDFAFQSVNSPILIIGEEVMRYDRTDNGIMLTDRGYAGTKAVPHKAGEPIIHLSGFYYNLVPIIDSPLFYDIAKFTAQAFDEGGYQSIYLDALDTTRKFIDDLEDMWYYCAAFVCELLKHCKKTPMIEASCMYPSMWAARGRFGAWDIGRRGYKRWNRFHAEENEAYHDMYATSTLGWYSFYPLDKKHPGNYHTRYEFTDDIDHLGILSLIYDSGIVFNDIEADEYFATPAMRRNITRYRTYDILRKKHYFSKEILEKVKNSPYESAVKEKNGDYVLVEKAYQQKKFYDVKDPARSSADFTNPFGTQKPFMRLMAHLSSTGENPQTLISIDKDAPMPGEKITREFEQELDLTAKCAKRVSVLGNGKKGVVAILLHGRETGRGGIMVYYIDTDFEGWREFILAESDNGDRDDLRYEHKLMETKQGYTYYLRLNACDDRIYKIEVDTDGNTEGVKISDIESVEHTFEELKDPAVTVDGNTVTFHCSLKSTDYIEFDGEKAIMYDRLGNPAEVAFTGSVTVPNGEFTATISAASRSLAPLRASLTFGFEGEEATES